MKNHELKCWPEFWKYMLTGEKSFEVRKNDRNFQVWDRLILKEWNPESEQYTGNIIVREISYVLHGGQLGIEDGYCVLGLRKI